MYRNILVAIADDERERTDEALALAAAIGAKDARVTLLHVLEAIPPFALSHIPEEARANRRSDAEAMLRGIAERTALPVEAVVKTGHGGHTIVEYAGEAGTDCILLNSHRPALQDIFFGSTAAHVVRHAPCAVHVLR